MAALLAYLLLGSGLLVTANRGDAPAGLWVGVVLAGAGALVLLFGAGLWDGRELRAERGPRAEEPAWFWEGLEPNRPTVVAVQVRLPAVPDESLAVRSQRQPAGPERESVAAPTSTVRQVAAA